LHANVALQVATCNGAIRESNEGQNTF
jgi:hypothetical protein